MVNKDERTCTYTPVLPTYSFSHSSNKMLTRINRNDKTTKRKELEGTEITNKYQIANILHFKQIII